MRRARARVRGIEHAWIQVAHVSCMVSNSHFVHGQTDKKKRKTQTNERNKILRT